MVSVLALLYHYHELKTCFLLQEIFMGTCISASHYAVEMALKLPVRHFTKCEKPH